MMFAYHPISVRNVCVCVCMLNLALEINKYTTKCKKKQIEIYVLHTIYIQRDFQQPKIESERTIDELSISNACTF